MNLFTHKNVNETSQMLNNLAGVAAFCPCQHSLQIEKYLEIKKWLNEKIKNWIIIFDKPCTHK